MKRSRGRPKIPLQNHESYQPNCSICINSFHSPSSSSKRVLSIPCCQRSRKLNSRRTDAHSGISRSTGFWLLQWDEWMRSSGDRPHALIALYIRRPLSLRKLRQLGLAAKAPAETHATALMAICVIAIKQTFFKSVGPARIQHPQGNLRRHGCFQKWGVRLASEARSLAAPLSRGFSMCFIGFAVYFA